jgi:ADP-heptose:LPS heptosyltransferase
VGFATEGRGWLLQRSTPYPEKHEVECFLDVLRADAIPVTSTRNENWTDPDTDRRVDAQLVENGRFRVFVCAKSVFALKDWAPERFAEVITWLLHDRNGEIHFCDSPGNAGYYAQILAGVPEELRGHCHDWSTKLGIREAGSLMRRMQLCLGIDTGFIHIAASFHVPVVGLYGPLEPWRWHPWDTKHTIVRPADVSGPRPLLRVSVAEVQAALEPYLPNA